MDLLALLRGAWKITWQQWVLWLLSLLMFATMTPAMTLSGAFGAVAGLVSAPALNLPASTVLPDWPAAYWVAAALGLWAALVVTSSLTWILQAAAMRGAALAADQAALTLTTALAIGRQRLWSLVKVSLTFGMLMMALAVAPPLLAILTSRLSGPPGQLWGLLQLTQAGLAPLSAALGLALFLLMMAVAVEDLTPLKALRRAWGVLRFGWWGFLLVFGLSSLPSLAVVILLLPVALTLPLAVMIPNGWVIPLLCGGVTIPLLMFVLLFTAVFTTTMYTLVYRVAAQLTPTGATPALA